MNKLWYLSSFVVLILSGCLAAGATSEPIITPTSTAVPTEEDVNLILTLEYRDRLAGCQQVLMTADSLSSGACDALQPASPLSSDFVTVNFEHFQETYASFEAETAGGHLTFAGRGDAEATPAEQRMIAEWARVAANVIQNGDTSGVGLLLSVHREGGLAGVCEDIALYASGELSITSCKGNGQTLATGRLGSTQLEQLFSWVDTYTSVEADHNEEVPADGLANHLVFVGRGDVLPGEAEQEAMLTFAGELYAQHTSSGPVADCPGAAVDRELFISEKADYCLLFPAGFEVTTPEEGVVVISGPDYGAGPEPLRGFVNITTFDAQGRTASAISDELVAPFLPDLMIERVEAGLGGERAVEIIGMPGQALTWQVVVVHEGRAYLLVFSPIGEEYGQATVDREALYQSIMASFTFLSPR